MNAAKLQAKKLLNYRFKNEHGRVKTANVIEVYKNIINSHHSAIETLTIWTTVLSDFIPQCLKKYVNETLRTKLERFDRLKILREYRSVYDTFITHLRWSIDRGLGVHNETNFDTIKFIIDDYKEFLRSLKSVRDEMVEYQVQTAEVSKKYIKPIQHFNQVLTYEKGRRGLHYVRQYY